MWRVLDRAPADADLDVLRLILPVFWAPDRARAERAAARLARQMARPGPASETAAAERYAVVACLLAHNELRFGRPPAALARVRTLDDEIAAWTAHRAGDTSASNAVDIAHVCARAIEAGVAVQRGEPEATDYVDALDEILENPPSVSALYVPALTPYLVTLWRRVGEPERALEATRRVIVSPYFRLYATDLGFEAARLHDELGAGEEAARGYGAYIAWRTAAEPPFDESVRHARARLLELGGEAP